MNSAKPKPLWNISSRRAAITFHMLIFLLAFAIIWSRRPDAIFNAQFYAEDGMVWYPQAYAFGLHSFLLPNAGYVHALIRTVALISLAFPFSLAPLIMNLCAIAVQILPANIFLSSRFSFIATDTRIAGTLLYVALPNSWEINANITNVQWHLALLACLLLIARPATTIGWRIFDVAGLVLTSFSSPLVVLLGLIAGAMWWKRRRKWSAISLAVLIPGSLTEMLTALLSHSRQLAPSGASFSRLISILGGQVFFAALLGWETLCKVSHGPFINETIAAVATVLCLPLVLYALRYAPLELKLFVVFCFAVLALGLARPLAGPPVYPQWVYLCVPGRGNRYFFFPTLGFLASLFWLANRRGTQFVRFSAVALLCLLPFGIYSDWSYPRFVDYHFQRYALQFERAPAGTLVSIPINPSMVMQITKR